MKKEDLSGNILFWVLPKINSLEGNIINVIDNVYVFLFRSGLAVKKGIDVGAGVVDYDYRGNIKVVLFNHLDEDFVVKKGERIAQFVIEKIYMPELVEVDVSNQIFLLNSFFPKSDPLLDIPHNFEECRSPKDFKFGKSDCFDSNTTLELP